MNFHLLAQAAGAAGDGGGMLTVGSVAITAIGGAVAAVLVAFKRGQANPKVNATLVEPVPEIPVKRVYSPPTYWQHKALEERVGKLETGMEVLRREQHEQFVQLMTAGESRKDLIFDKIDTMARAFHARVDDLLSAPKSK